MGLIQFGDTHRSKGEAVQNFELFSRAWDECVELQQQSKSEWLGRSILSLQELDRHELFAYADGRVVGGIVLANDPWDSHVGPCVSVFAQYVLPEYRLQNISPTLMRMATRLAKESGASTLAHTHRIGAWRYSTFYRRLRSQN